MSLFTYLLSLKISFCLTTLTKNFKMNITAITDWWHRYFPLGRKYNGNETPTSKTWWRSSLVVQCLSICLPMQGHGFDPWFRKISHAVGQLSPCTTATKACMPLSPCSNKRSHLNGKPTHGNSSSSHLLQLEKADVQQCPPHQENTQQGEIKEIHIIKCHMIDSISFGKIT